ncbi:MAG TPA: serine/threonine-protein kinase [Terracidiphilus sp.]|jgi:serine/threonine-protein kinase|nr:serine/threonine-protein kinase [Terracidiphilus sp.]
MPDAGDILDHYRLDAVVARSGMATLFRATDLRNAHTVAIKVPHPEMEADPVLLERFRREQEIGQLFDHPGIVKTYDGEERSQLYMVLEWVEGRLLRAALNEERKLPPERAVRIAGALCDALDAMHKRGIVHRDLKPENVMLCEGDQIKIIDFGIAMKEDARRITHVGASPLLGTPDYISPEQVQGKRGDQRSDIYALGIMLYEMLTGRVPFSGPNPLAVMNDRLVKDPPSPRALNPAIAPELEEIVYRALERDPRHRYATAHEMQWELEHQEQVGVEERGRSQRGAGRSSLLRRINKRTLLYACLVLVPIALFGLMLVMARR